MIQKQKAVSRGLRYGVELDKRIEAATKKGGFSSPSAFMREAIERELLAVKVASTRLNNGSPRVWIVWLERFEICG